MTRYKNVRLLLVALLLAPTVWAELAVTLRPVADGLGGARAQPNADFEWILAYYANGTAKQQEPSGLPSIGIASLEASRPEVIDGATYRVALKQQVTSTGRRISAASAFLYETYAKGNLGRWLPAFIFDNASLTQLQSAIRALEGGATDEVPANFQTLLLAHFGSWTLAQEPYYGSTVRVMTLSPEAGGPSADYLLYLPDSTDHETLGAPLLAARNTGGGGGGGGGGGFVPPTVIPPTNPVDPNFPVVPPVTPNGPNGDDITSSTPPPPPFPPTPFTPDGPVDPTDNNGVNPPPRTSVPDGGLTGSLLGLALGVLAWARRRSSKGTPKAGNPLANLRSAGSPPWETAHGRHSKRISRRADPPLNVGCPITER